MKRTKSEELALLVIHMANTLDLRRIQEAKTLALKVLADHVVQDIVNSGPRVMSHEPGCACASCGRRYVEAVPCDLDTDGDGDCPVHSNCAALTRWP